MGKQMLFLFFVYEALRAFADPECDAHAAGISTDRCGICHHRFGDGVPETRRHPSSYFSEIRGRAASRHAAYRVAHA